MSQNSADLICTAAEARNHAWYKLRVTILKCWHTGRHTFFFFFKSQDTSNHKARQLYHTESLHLPGRPVAAAVMRDTITKHFVSKLK
jgi:hypothetical protein